MHAHTHRHNENDRRQCMLARVRRRVSPLRGCRRHYCGGRGSVLLGCRLHRCLREGAWQLRYFTREKGKHRPQKT